MGEGDGCFKLLLLGHGILSVPDLRPMQGAGTTGWGDGLHGGGVLWLDSAQRVWRGKGGVW